MMPEAEERANLVCTFCGRRFSLDEPRWRCDCGHPLNLEFKGRLDTEKIKKGPASIWRYREALPIEDDGNIVSFGEGFTPLIKAEILGKPVLLKLEFLFPTGSFKDRGASVLISKVKELGIKKVVEDSSGNAGCAIAAYCARAGIECHIYVPESTSPAKLVQIKSYGAHLHKIPGTRADTANAALEAAQDHYYASHSWNPFFFQGTKTFAFEIWEQLKMKAPDTAIIPTGNGTLLIGTFLGFQELLNLGLIQKMPKLIAVQAGGCAPLSLAFQSGQKEIPEIKALPTIAEGIAISQPIRGAQILEIVHQTEGKILTVSEKEIIEAMRTLGALGIFAEPTAAVAVAAFLNMPVSVETVVVPITGHGLKSVEEYQNLSGF